MSEKKLRIGLPKGSLEEATVELFRRAGYAISRSSRGYRPYIDHPGMEVRLVRPQELARYVTQGFLDCGITGMDWILENEASVHLVCELPYNRSTRLPVRWVLAVHESSPIRSPKDLQGKRIATEAVRLVSAYLERHGVKAEVEFSWGATEVKVPELVDAIVDISETGSSLQANNLRVVDTVLQSYPQFLCSHSVWADAERRKQIESLALLLLAALRGEEKVGLKMNVAKDGIEAVLGVLPALRRPTVSPLADGEWLAVETVLDESQVRDLIPRLKELGAEGIIEYPLNKVIY
ncbi:ATP phosphoribosyltransferase [Methylacidimicrobium sp. B4]|uniref:ATP phosphoribosyltransferase n=1 Tax=Methylacidimicrobium sp. B4 TaxID=2796139 RepID=UPI001A8E6CC1|nr:ATP phosphoribosyltransferase [Methylacidimicrobium sp. B4]QSR84622.1 ATP phosphoribosyltransferase [Methylacidimicrobium sp. B4]